MYKAISTVKGPGYDINQGDKITDDLFNKKLIDRHKAKFVKVDDKTHELEKEDEAAPENPLTTKELAKKTYPQLQEMAKAITPEGMTIPKAKDELIAHILFLHGEKDGAE